MDLECSTYITENDEYVISFILKVNYKNISKVRNIKFFNNIGKDELTISKTGSNDYKVIYKFNVENEFFDLISRYGTRYLNGIFKECKLKYLNKEIWGHLIDSKIIKKNYILTIEKKKRDLAISHKNKKKKDEVDIFEKNFNNYIDYKYGKLENVKLKPLKHYYFNECIYKENDLIVCFLDIIFNLNIALNIKKCTMCDKYFIVKSGNHYKCSRVYLKNLTCSEYSDKIRRQFTNDKPINKLKSYLRNRIPKDDDEAYYDFSLKIEKLGKKYYGDKKGYVNSLLNSYCKDKKDKENLIKEFELQEYLK